MDFKFLLGLTLLGCTGAVAASAPADSPPERAPVHLAPEEFANFVGRYVREETTVLVFRDHEHFFIKVGHNDRVEIFPLSDHEFLLAGSRETLSFERGAHGEVTHFIRHSAAPQIFRRVH